MFDNVDFYMLQEDYPGINFLNEIPKHVTAVSEGVSNYGEYFVGNYYGYKVLVNKHKITFSQFSLAKLRFGTNLKTLTRGDTQQLIEHMTDELHLPIKEARLTRIDIAQHIPLKQPPEVYLPMLGPLQYYDRLEQPHSIRYQNTKRTIVFYNKIEEQQQKKRIIEELYKGANLLRYELRFISRLPQQFNQPKVPMSLLINQSFYFELVQRWKKEYLAIKKVSTNTECLCPTSSSKKLIEQLAATSVLQIGQNNIIKLISEWQMVNTITKKQAFDLRQAIQKISTAGIRAETNDLILELDKKIRDAARFC